MTKSLKDFAQNNAFDAKQGDINQNYNSFFEQHKNKSQSQLQDELLREAKRQKDAGTFDYQKLQNVFETMRPYLNDQQLDYMNKLLQGLK